MNAKEIKGGIGGHAVVYELHRDGRGITAVCYTAWQSSDPQYIRSRMFKTRRGADAYASKFLTPGWSGSVAVSR